MFNSKSSLEISMVKFLMNFRDKVRRCSDEKSIAVVLKRVSSVLSETHLRLEAKHTSA